MLRTILVPLDGSDLASSILPTVETVAALTGASVTLVQVVEPAESPRARPEPTALLSDADERASERAHASLISVAQRLSHRGLTVQTQVLVGHPADQIIQAGPAFDLIAMATHGRGGLGRWAYGSVADKVVRGASVPVLLVRAEPEAPVAQPVHRLLVPLDGSDLAEKALPLAIDLAQRAGAEVILTQSVAWAIMATAYPYGYGLGTAELLEQAQTDAEAYLTAVRQRLLGEGLAVHTAVRVEAAADAILDLATEQRADLIVMSTHGRGGLGRWVLGSVADRVLRGATVPVLLVRVGGDHDVRVW